MDFHRFRGCVVFILCILCILSVSFAAAAGQAFIACLPV
jgi:hypothetical protein